MGRNSKKKKVIIVLIVILLVLLVATCVVLGFMKNSEGLEKQEFFAKLSNNDLKFFTSNKLYTTILNKLQDNDYNCDTNMTLYSTMENNMFSELDLSKFEFNYNLTKNNKDNKSYSQFTAQYASNPLITLDFISNNDEFALKSDEIVNKYLAVKNGNIQNVLTKSIDTDIDFATFRKLNNFLTERESINLDNIANLPELVEYVKILENNVSKNQVSKKENVVVPLDSEQVQTTEYTITFNKDETTKLLEEISQKVKDDNSITPELIVTNIQNFEDDSEILEYTDNDMESENNLYQNNISQNTTLQNEISQNSVSQNTISGNNTTNQVQAEENNFETAMSIWGENTITNSLSNTTNQNNIIIDANTTNPMNIVTPQNTIENDNTSAIEINSDNEDSSDNGNDNLQTDENSNNNTINTTNTVVEDENLRPQGFIEVNNSSDDSEESEFFIGANFDETLENVTKLCSKIDWKTYLISGAKVNVSQDELIAEFAKVIENQIKENDNLVIKAYFSEDKLVKINFEMTEKLKSLDIEIASKKENEKTLKMSFLEGQTDKSNGQTISIYKKIADSNVENVINVNKISNNSIIQKTSININTKGTSNSKDYMNTLMYTYSNNEGEFKVNLENNLNFDVDISDYDLTDENSLFLDDLTDSELENVNNQIEEQLKKVLGEKNKNLNIIDINNSNLIVKQTETQENEEEKNAAREALINAVAMKMREYLDNGTELQLQDLKDLQIENYEVEISINSNLAIIIVNGYRFTLDSEFNLSDS